MTLLLEIDQPGELFYGHTSALAQEYYDQIFFAEIEATPSLFCTIQDDGDVLGCFGAYYGSLVNPLMAETYLSKKTMEQFLGSSKRECLVEFGTLILESRRNIRLFPLMAANMVLRANDDGFTHAIFTSTERWGQWVSNHVLQTNASILGTVNIDSKDDKFKENWGKYFSKERLCFGLRIADALEGCRKFLEKEDVIIAK